MSDAKEVEDVEKFMTILMEVKVTLAEQNGKLDSLLDIKQKVDTTYDIAHAAHTISLKNEKDIERLQEKVATKSSKEDINRIVEEKDNWKKSLPSWVAVAVSICALLVTIFTIIN